MRDRTETLQMPSTACFSGLQLVLMQQSPPCIHSNASWPSSLAALLTLSHVCAWQGVPYIKLLCFCYNRAVHALETGQLLYVRNKSRRSIWPEDRFIGLRELLIISLRSCKPFRLGMMCLLLTFRKELANVHTASASSGIYTIMRHFLPSWDRAMLRRTV